MSNSLFPQRPTKRALVALVAHTIVFGLVYWLAFSVRSEFVISEADFLTLWITLPGIVILKLIVFYYAGHCHRSWYSVSFSDLVALFHSATLSVLIIATVDKLFINSIHPPRGVLLLDWALTILVLGGLYALNRLSREELRPRFFRGNYQKALIIGANQSGETLARHLLADQRLKYHVIGFLDQDPARRGSTLNGIPVLGTPEQAVPLPIDWASRTSAGDLRRALRPAGAAVDGGMRAGEAHAEGHSGVRRPADQRLLGPDSQRRHQRLAAARAGRSSTATRSARSSPGAPFW